jgi:hypothetical protein
MDVRRHLSDVENTSFTQENLEQVANFCTFIQKKKEVPAMRRQKVCFIDENAP